MEIVMGQSNTPKEPGRRSGGGITKRNMELGRDEWARRKINDGCAAVVRGENAARLASRVLCCESGGAFSVYVPTFPQH